MTTTTERRLLVLAAVTLTTWAAGCHHADSILLVEVAGDLRLMPVSFAVTVTPGQLAAKNLRIAPPSDTISLPASFSIELPGNVIGPVTVAVQALDAYATIIAQGTATQQDLNVGAQTILVVMLTATGSIDVIHPPDAGQPTADAQVPRDAQPDVGAADAAAVDASLPDAAVLDAAVRDAAADAARQMDATADGSRPGDAGGRS